MHGLDVVAARLPGRGDRFGEDPMTAFTPLVEHLLEGIKPFTGVPFALFGHSMGALLAYELGRRLEAQDTPPVLVVAAGMWSPSTWMRRPGQGSANAEPPTELLASTNPELRDLILPILRADLAVLADYRYDDSFPPLAAPTRVYYGTDEVSDPGGLERDWRLAVRGELLVHGFPGGHFFLDSEQEAVTERVARDVEAAMAHR